VRSEILTAAIMKMAVFWVVATCRLVEVYLRYRGGCCLPHQGDVTHKNNVGELLSHKTAQHSGRQPSLISTGPVSVRKCETAVSCIFYSSDEHKGDRNEAELRQDSTAVS
jgi:hypothetical protein